MLNDIFWMAARFRLRTKERGKLVTPYETSMDQIDHTYTVTLLLDPYSRLQILIDLLRQFNIRQVRVKDPNPEQFLRLSEITFHTET